MHVLSTTYKSFSTMTYEQLNSTQRALWATKEALRAKAHGLREAKQARAEEELIVRRWQVYGLIVSFTHVTILSVCSAG